MTKNISINRILLLGLVFIVALLAWTARWYLHFTNYSGLIVFPDSKVVRILPDGPAAKTDFQVGDRIVTLDDQRISNFTEYVNIVQNNEVTGQSIQVEVQRKNGEVHRFPMAIVSYPVFHASGMVPYFGILLLIFGLYVFLKKPEDPSAGIYLVLNCCLFVLLALSNHLLKQFSSPFISLFWGLSFMLLVPVNLHFYLVFPEQKQMIKKRPWILAILYFIPLVFMALLTRTVLEMDWALKYGIDSGDEFKRINSLFANYFWIAIPATLAFLASVIHSYKKADSLEQKKQFQIILIGAMSTLIMAVPVILGLILNFKSPEIIALWPSWGFSMLFGAGVFTTMLVPVSMALAILKYRLWDVDTAINRSLIYMGVSVVLIALYFLIVGLLGWGFGLVAKPASHLPVLVFTLTVAIISEPLRHFIKRLVDHNFNREAYEYGQTLSTFSRELSTIHYLNELTQGLCETVSKALDIQNIAVMLQDRNDSKRYQLAAVEGLPDFIADEELQGDDAIVRLVKTHQGPFAPQEHTDSTGLPDQLLKGLYIAKKARANLIVPIRKGQELLGWISLGRKKADTLFTTEDRQLLETLANQAAVAIINAFAFDQIDTLNRGLKEKITKVEEQSNEIQRLQKRLLQENLYFKEQIKNHYDFTEIIGAGHGLSQVMGLVENAAQSDATILLLGESGTGKELIARAIHFSSPLNEGPFIKINCAALSEGVLQSELFGHEKGAFTGAHEARDGRFKLADGGTILLDEIGDIPLPTQILLLRVLQEQEFERVGGNKTIKVKVRVIAATNRNLEEAVAQEKFRADLYYRLKVITIDVPPLKERREDILELALHFVKKYSKKYGKRIIKIDEKVLDRFKQYDWPGNVREIENIIERAVVISKSETMVMEDIPMELQILNPEVENIEKAGTVTDKAHSQVINDIERTRLIEALTAARGNKSLAARSLGLKRSTFFNKLKKYDLLT